MTIWVRKNNKFEVIYYGHLFFCTKNVIFRKKVAGGDSHLRFLRGYNAPIGRKEALVDWNKIKAEYIAGGTSYRKLCAKYGVSRTTLQRKAKDENWLGLRSQAEAKTESKIVNDVSKQNAKMDDTYFRCVDKLMQKAEELIASTTVWQPAMLKEMATTMKYLKECKGVRSDADMREQEARIKKIEQEISEANADRDIRVIIEGDLEKYSK